ncbi:MAG: GAF domain-containing protein [Elusimicrobia bacterium]|nr:GAF domain-containing protein [Elusimicrobiota bacterium]
MTRPSTPPDENERLDRITRLARTLFDAPVALIGLADADRQRLRSRPGLDEAQTPDAESFCARAILGSEVLEVPDAERDEGLRGGPTAAGEPRLRFFAGVPLTSPEGRKVGTLCLADLRPRTLSADERRALKDLAAIAERTLAETAPAAPPPDPAAAAALARRRASRERWLTAAFVAVVAVQLTAAVVSYRRVRALVAATRTVSAAERDARVEKDAAALVAVAAFARGVGATVVILAFFIVRRYVRERTRAEDALAGARDSALRDAGARRRAQEETNRLSARLHAVIDQIDDGVLLLETGGAISLYNRSAERILGTWRGEFERFLRATELPAPLARALKGETVRDAAVTLKTPYRAAPVALTVRAVPLRGPQELTTGAIVVFREADARPAGR